MMSNEQHGTSKPVERVLLSDLYDALPDHLAETDEPFDADNGLAELHAWIGSQRDDRNPRPQQARRGKAAGGSDRIWWPALCWAAHESGFAGRTTVRMQLGTRLRRLREAKGVTREYAGSAIRASESKISGMELGRVGVKEHDVAGLLALYGVDDEERSALLTLGRHANTPNWWSRYSDLQATWMRYYLDLEAAATLIRTYEVQFVPGLLQTEDYARAVVELGHAESDAEEIDRRVELRMARKKLLARPDQPRLWAIIDEAVLRRPIGGSAVMRNQIETLVEACDLPQVRLQVLPFRAGGHAPAGGAFTILRFAEQELPDVVYLEHLASALYLDKRQDVERYLAAAARLFIAAEPPARTPQILREAGRDL